MTSNELPYRPTLAERIPGPFLIFRAFLLAFSPSILALSAAAKDVDAFARKEGLTAHARSAMIRTEGEQ